MVTKQYIFWTSKLWGGCVVNKIDPQIYHETYSPIQNDWGTAFDMIYFAEVIKWG